MSDAVAEGVEQLALAWLDHVPELVERLLVAIFTDHPDGDYDPVPREDLREGCERYLTRVLELVSGKVRATLQDDVAAEIARRRSDQGVPLEVMLRTFRLGGRVVWEALLEEAEARGVEPDLTLSAATSMWTVIEELSSSLSTAYRTAEFERLRQDDQRRHGLVEDLLRGRGHDPAFAQRAATELDLPLVGRYAVVVADVLANGSTALAGAPVALASVQVHAVWTLRSDTFVGLVALEHRDVAAVVSALRPHVRGRASISPAVDGIGEIGLAHELALAAWGTIRPGTAELVALEERYPEALLVQSPELARRLVATKLGPVLERPAPEREALLQTLAVWLECECSAAHAAERLYCHRNTVLNRLQRIAALTGQTLHGRKAYVELALAVAALDLPKGSNGATG